MIALLVSQASAQVQITYGTVEGSSRFIDLLPNQAGQQVQLFVTGLGAGGATGADGFEFDGQIGDGGSILNGTDTGPVFESVDFTTGTVLTGWTQTDPVASPLAWRTLAFDAMPVNQDGLLGTITFDTTGFNSGIFDFALTNVAGFDSRFTLLDDEIPTNAPNGFLRIQAVPEPSMALIGVLGLGAIVLRRRR